MSSVDFFSKSTLSKNSFWNRMSNILDPDMDHSVGPDLGQNCLQRLSADNKSRRQQGKTEVLR